MEHPQWLVAHVRPQWEQIVCKQISGWYGLPFFCPFYFEKRRFANGYKNISVPMFKNYVFVQIVREGERINVLRLDGVIDFVKYNGRPAVVRDAEMVLLREMVEAHGFLKAVPVLRKGMRTLIPSGVFEGMEAVVGEVMGNKVCLELKELGWRMVVGV